MIEKEAAASFALTATDTQLDTLEAAHRDIVRRAAAGISPALLADAQAVDWGLHDAMVDALGNEILSALYRVNSLRIRLIRLDRVTLDADVLAALHGGASRADRRAAHAGSASRGGRHRCPSQSRAQPRARHVEDFDHAIEPERRVRGLWCATLTPLDRDGRIDAARMAAHVRLLLGQGVDGVAPFGTTGEGSSFSVAERRSGLDALLAGGITAATHRRRDRARPR